MPKKSKAMQDVEALISDETEISLSICRKIDRLTEFKPDYPAGKSAHDATIQQLRQKHTESKDKLDGFRSDLELKTIQHLASDDYGDDVPTPRDRVELIR